jgi:hypothetical protein
MRPTDLQFDSTAHFDVVVASSGYEDRSTYLCRLGLRGDKNFAILLPGDDDLNLASRDCYRSAGWEVGYIEQILEACETSLRNSQRPKICIDISSMPRSVVAKIVEWLWFRSYALSVQFVYCPAAFDDSSVAAGIDSPLTAEPVSDFFRGELRAPSLPIGLVVGLGLEPYRALGIVELLEPSRTWAFLAEGTDDRFEKASESMHSHLVSESGGRLLMRYRMDSLEKTYAALESLTFSTGLKYRLLFAPSGPKLFSLACMLVAAPRGTGRPAVWRVGRDSSTDPRNITAAGEVIACEVAFGDNN